MMKLAIIIPAHNEEKTVYKIVKKSQKYGKVIVIDDASSDNTLTEARKAGAIIIRHKTNRGLGGALRSGFEKALRMNIDAVVTLDADGQHNPDEIPRFIKALENGNEFVLGERDLRRYPFIKKFGNFFLNAATNFISGTTVRDSESGFRAISRDALKRMYMKAERYEIAVEIIFEVGRNKLRTENVRISSPVYVKGVSVFDGINNFRYLLRRRKRNWMSYLQDVRYVFRRWL